MFRLTDDEYQELQSACRSNGARNVSDYARTALLEAVDRERQDMTRRLAEIQSGVERLEQILTAFAKEEA